jgi:hypothetical protein
VEVFAGNSDGTFRRGFSPVQQFFISAHRQRHLLPSSLPPGLATVHSWFFLNNSFGPGNDVQIAIR